MAKMVTSPVDVKGPGSALSKMEEIVDKVTKGGTSPVDVQELRSVVDKTEEVVAPPFDVRELRLVPPYTHRFPDSCSVLVQQ